MASALAAGLTLSFSTTALANDLDAAITVLPSSYSAFPQMAQVYTALHTGQLYQISLDAGAGYTYAPVTITVTTLTNGVPSTTALATLDAQTPSSLLFPNLAWRTYTLNPRVPVTAGTKYAISTAAGTFGSLGNYFRWGYTNISNANFTGGEMLVRNFNGGAWSQLGTGSWGFDFKTWVATQVNQPPVIAFANPLGVSVPEGTAPTMTGTYSDPNGGTVALTADYGQVNGSNGTWTWTGPATDEGIGPSSVKITATDSASLSASVTFPLHVTGVTPVATITTDPVSVPEGNSVTLLGTATSPDPADQAVGFTYAWDVTKDGNAFAAASGSSFTLHATDEGIFVITMQATDDGGMTGTTTMTVAGTEVTPTATINGVSPADPNLTIIAPQETLNFAGSFSDPAQEPHTFRWDFGDGSFSTSLNTSHAYAAAGTYTVTFTVTDDEKVAGQTTTRVTVQTTQQSVASMIAYVNSLTTLNKGQKQSLIAKLNAASDASARGDNQAAHNQLNAFINELAADWQTGKISKTAYDALRADAHAIQGALGTYNRFVEWWPLAA